MEKDIRRNIIILAVVTFLLLIIMTAAWSFALYRPLREKIEKEQGEVQALTQQAQKLPDALKAKALAEEKREYVRAQLNFFQSRFRSLYFDYGAATDPPDIKEAKKKETWQRWMDEYYVGYGVALKRELLSISSRAGVNIVTAVKVNAPPKAPEEMPEVPSGFMKPVSENGGTLNVTVTGSYPQLMNFFNLINESNILMVIGAIKLEGSSPFIRTSFTITPYLVQRGPAVQAKGAAPPPPPPPPPSAAPAPVADDTASEPAEDTGGGGIAARRGGGGGDE